jgi:5-methylcytosine-specific restriction endonuclease McrA
MTTYKKCSICKESLPTTAFGKGGNKDGLRGQCKSCTNAREKARLDKDRGAYNAKRRKLYADSPTYADSKKAAAKKRYWDNPEHARNKHNASSARNKLERALRVSQKRAESAEIFTAAQIRQRWSVYGISEDHCFYCGKDFDGLPAEEQQIDHIHEIHLGGPHNIENVVPCCGDCNIRKSHSLRGGDPIT